MKYSYEVWFSLVNSPPGLQTWHPSIPSSPHMTRIYSSKSPSWRDLPGSIFLVRIPPLSTRLSSVPMLVPSRCLPLEIIQGRDRARLLTIPFQRPAHSSWSNILSKLLSLEKIAHIYKYIHIHIYLQFIH